MQIASRQNRPVVIQLPREIYATKAAEVSDLWRGQALARLRGDWMARMRLGLEDERRAGTLSQRSGDLERQPSKQINGRAPRVAP
jgi:hypothetical protein